MTYYNSNNGNGKGYFKGGYKKRWVGKRKADPVVTKSQLYRALHRQAETKIVSTSYGLTLFNSSISGSADFITCLPPIGLGTGQSSRIGDEVKPIKLVIKGYITYNMTLAGGPLSDARIIGGRLFCFQDKANKCYQNSIFNNTLLDNGGTSSTFTGVTINYTQPVNTDEFTWYCDKKMVFRKPFGVTNAGTGASATTSITGFDDSLFQEFEIVLTQKELPSKLKWESGVSPVNPVNFAPYIALGYVDLSGSAPDSVVTQLAMQFVSTLYYEDS